MASGITTYAANYLLDKLLRGDNFSWADAPGTEYWFAAYLDGAQAYLAANDTGNFPAFEVSTTATGYVRVKIRGATGIDFNLAAAGTATNNADFAFAAASGSWGSVKTIAILDAATNGNAIMYGDLTVARSITTPDVLRVPSGQWAVSI